MAQLMTSTIPDHPSNRTPSMLFHTWVFAVFFLIVYPVYLLVRKNNRLMNIWLMIASYTFYGWWNPAYLLLLFGTSAIDYAMVLLMERSGPRGRKLWLIISLVSNFGFLGYFKYSGFLTANINAPLRSFRAWASSCPIRLPIRTPCWRFWACPRTGSSRR